MEEKTKQLKVIITFAKDRASIGIVQTDCDPILFMKQGTQDEVLAAVAECIAAAKERWGTNSRYPKIELPASPTPTPSSIATRKPTAAPSAGTKPMF